MGQTANSNRTHRAVDGFVSNSVNFNTGTSVPVTARYLNLGNGTSSNVWGVNSDITNQGSGVLSTVYGLRSKTSNTSTGSITNVSGVFIDTPTVDAGVITTATGLRICSQKITGVTNGRGIIQSGVDDLNLLYGQTRFNSGTAPLPSVSFISSSTISSLSPDALPFISSMNNFTGIHDGFELLKARSYDHHEDADKIIKSYIRPQILNNLSKSNQWIVSKDTYCAIGYAINCILSIITIPVSIL